jgi:bifunctional DNA-binding transcriptional regulator/antitoxin component of YhaV-PrlF toxin-antitoxin module
MDTVKLGKSGQLSVPRAVLRQLGLKGDETLIVDVTADGAIQLRPAAVTPIELYTPARLESFEAELVVNDKTRTRVKAALAAHKTRKRRG